MEALCRCCQNPLRLEYEKKVHELRSIPEKLKAEGYTEDQIARAMHEKRRELGQQYKEAAPPLFREYIYEATAEKYGDPLGPTYDMDGTGGLSTFDNPVDWIDFLAKHKQPETVPEGRVPATQFIFVRDEDRKIVGMIDIRHSLSEYLEKFGGHIGYSVIPDERRRGYATQMLRAALPVCKELGITKVLITCIKGNEGSKRTILNNGGVYESVVFEPDEKVELERYWIAL